MEEERNFSSRNTKTQVLGVSQIRVKHFLTVSFVDVKWRVFVTRDLQNDYKDLTL